jgi:hypothetical protein
VSRFRWGTGSRLAFCTSREIRSRLCLAAWSICQSWGRFLFLRALENRLWPLAIGTCPAHAASASVTVLARGIMRRCCSGPSPAMAAWQQKSTACHIRPHRRMPAVVALVMVTNSASRRSWSRCHSLRPRCSDQSRESIDRCFCGNVQTSFMLHWCGASKPAARLAIQGDARSKLRR